MAPSTTTLKNSIELKCEYEGGDGQFTEWFKDGIPVSADKPGHYVVKQNEKESILIIKIFGKDKKKEISLKNNQINFS